MTLVASPCRFMRKHCQRTCFNLALDVFRNSKSLASDPHLEYYFSVCGHPDGHCDTEAEATVETTTFTCVDRELSDLCASWVEDYRCATPSALQLQEAGSLASRRTHLRMLAPTTTPANNYITIGVTGADSLDPSAFAEVALWHFTNRHSSQYASATTNDAGEYSLEFLTPQPRDSAASSLQRLSVFPFGLQEVKGAMGRHTFASTVQKSASVPDRNGFSAPPPEAYYMALQAPHLGLTKLDFLDTSSFAIRGTVTRNGQNMLRDGVACAKEGIEICAFELPEDGNTAFVERDDPTVCSISDAAGDFLLTVMIGTSVVILPRSDYDLHSVVADPSSSSASLTDGEAGFTIHNIEEDVTGVNFAGAPFHFVSHVHDDKPISTALHVAQLFLPRPLSPSSPSLQGHIIRLCTEKRCGSFPTALPVRLRIF